MPLVTTHKMLHDAQSGRYAVGDFNIENMEMAQAVTAADELNAPVILQTTPGTLRYASLEVFYANVAVPLAIHLDHSNRC